MCLCVLVKREERVREAKRKERKTYEKWISTWLSPQILSHFATGWCHLAHLEPLDLLTSLVDLRALVQGAHTMLPCVSPSKTLDLVDYLRYAIQGLLTKSIFPLVDFGCWTPSAFGPCPFCFSSSIFLPHIPDGVREVLLGL